MANHAKRKRPVGLDSFVEAVDRFLDAADWLTDEDEPMTTSLVVMAHKLDHRFTAATMAQFGLSFRYLAKRNPKGDEAEKDELERILDGED